MLMKDRIEFNNRFTSMETHQFNSISQFIDTDKLYLKQERQLSDLITKKTSLFKGATVNPCPWTLKNKFSPKLSCPPKVIT